MNIAEIMERDIEEALREVNLDATAAKIENRERRTAREDLWLIAIIWAAVAGLIALAWYVYHAGLTLEDVGLL